ncbi:hypothetical protein HanRHA438_Chr01g0024451 [Helianthus annuus]|nr:hypothetical protein HanRHA438_Chr01g0024451 [Helianthus annuus]
MLGTFRVSLGVSIITRNNQQMRDCLIQLIRVEDIICNLRNARNKKMYNHIKSIAKIYTRTLIIPRCFIQSTSSFNGSTTLSAVTRAVSEFSNFSSVSLRRREVSAFSTRSSCKSFFGRFELRLNLFPIR